MFYFAHPCFFWVVLVWVLFQIPHLGDEVWKQLACTHFTGKPKHSKQWTTNKLSKADELAQHSHLHAALFRRTEGVALKIIHHCAFRLIRHVWSPRLVFSFSDVSDVIIFWCSEASGGNTEEWVDQDGISVLLGGVIQSGGEVLYPSFPWYPEFMEYCNLQPVTFSQTYHAHIYTASDSFEIGRFRAMNYPNS